MGTVSRADLGGAIPPRRQRIGRSARRIQFGLWPVSWLQAGRGNGDLANDTARLEVARCASAVRRQRHAEKAVAKAESFGLQDFRSAGLAPFKPGFSAAVMAVDMDPPIAGKRAMLHGVRGQLVDHQADRGRRIGRHLRRALAVDIEPPQVKGLQGAGQQGREREVAPPPARSVSSTTFQQGARPRPAAPGSCCGPL